MSPIETFTNFVRDRAFAVENLAELTDVIETVKDEDGRQGYRLTRSQTGDTVSPDKIRHRCKILMYYAWHSRDHVKKILMNEGHLDAAEVGTLLNSFIRQSQDLQICSYLANEYKHAGVDDSQKWAMELAPRYGDIYVFGAMTGFPMQMKPTIMFTSKEPQFELTGFAQVDSQQFPFAGFEWTVSCVIEDKDGNVLGDAISICERAFHTWLLVLRQQGVQIDFDNPMRSSIDGILIALSKKQS